MSESLFAQHDDGVEPVNLDGRQKVVAPVERGTTNNDLLSRGGIREPPDASGRTMGTICVASLGARKETSYEMVQSAGRGPGESVVIGACQMDARTRVEPSSVRW